MIEFESTFKPLTGQDPLTWQARLYERFASDNLPDVIDLPTGLGKTMVMAVWLIARAANRNVPTRLVYVVDRRTVVDQATDLAKTLLKNWTAKGVFPGDPPVISTLRGQLADNREWSRDPTRPAIVIGTVDLIGSALLFSGYRSSYKRRPLEAGLLGQDTLLVLDEAHLSTPFANLLNSITALQACDSSTDFPVKPLRVIRMSATTSDQPATNTFGLQFDNRDRLTGDDAQDSTIIKRFRAAKTLHVATGDKPVDELVKRATHLATDEPDSRIVIFVRSPKQVAEIAKALSKKKEFATRVAQLTGTMRGWERDRLVEPVSDSAPLGDHEHERRVMQRFLQADNDPSLGPCFLISTSAGEVGFDLNADHLIGDEAPLDSWIQRLGRVNRRGEGKATVILVRKQNSEPKSDFDKACLATSALLEDGMDVSPIALAAFRRSLSVEQHAEASSPTPATVALTDILLDAWSMTSISKPMPGRPEVAPWLRGIAEWEPPQTTIAWRSELDLEGFSELDLEDMEEWFDTHRILPHETLRANTSDVAAWFIDRWDTLSDEQQTRLALHSVVVDRAGIEVVSLGDVVNRLSRKSGDVEAFLRGAEIIVPASFGGICRGIGLLDSSAPTLGNVEDEDVVQSSSTKPRHRLCDVADVRGRFRETVEKSDGGLPVPTPLDPDAVKPALAVRYSLEIVSQDDRTVRLISYVPRFEKPEYGSKPQRLDEHVGAVRGYADQIVAALLLASDDPMRRALELAADWHDHGKKRERWQRLLVFPSDHDRTDEVMAKSGASMKRDPRGYRHEFGSIREFNDAFLEGTLLDNFGKPISPEIFDMAMHLIASHHGRGRPHFPKGGFDPECEARSDGIHTATIRRFAKLQKKYGWWRLAWLENLLRCADSLASAEAEATKIDDVGGDRS